MRSKTIFFMFLTLILLVSIAWCVFFFMEGKAPLFTLSLDKQYVSPNKTLKIQATDEGRGLKEIQVYLLQSGQHLFLFEKKFEGSVWNWEGEFSLAGQRITDGPAELVVTATDNSLCNWGKGNISILRQPVIIDALSPRISIINNTEYLNQGGTGIISYTLSEEVERTGVAVADRFFPAYKNKDGKWLCLFSFPYDADPDKDNLELLAVDAAGNEGKVRFFQRVRKAQFPHDTIRINDRFLQTSMPDFQQYFPGESNLLQLYLKVNKELRRQNRAALFELGLKTAQEPLWDGRFLQLRNSATRATFGDKRTYLYNGQEIDHQQHLGLDFASIARSPVEACNHGKVIFAGVMGIYGQVVILDHGLGLQSLYAHLSQIDVQAGNILKKGDIIGKTGTTGLAGGDHLHLGISVSGTLVNPIEWLDSKWIKNSIMAKMN